MMLRIQFEKKGALRFSSHRDIVRAMQRSFTACEVPVAYSEGFHPHMKMSFGPPAKTGWGSDEEYMDVTVTSAVGADFTERCNAHLPDGLAITHVMALPERSPKLVKELCAARMEIQVRNENVFGSSSTNSDELQRLRNTIGAEFIGKDDSGNVPQILDVSVSAEDEFIGITYTSTMLEGKIVAPTDVVESSIGDPAAFDVPIYVTRKAQYVERNGELRSPIDKGV